MGHEIEKAKPLPEERLWNKHFILACIISTFSSIAMTMMNSTMAKFVMSIFGNARFSGYLNTVFGLTAIIARLLSGNLSDRKGRRNIIIFGLVIFAVCVFGFGALPYAVPLLIFRGLQGFGFSTSATTVNAAGADIIPEKRMSEGIGYLGFGYSLAMAFGAALALSLIKDDNYQPVFFVCGGILVISIILAFFFNYEKNEFYIEKLKKQRRDLFVKDLSAYKGLSKYVEYKALPATVVQILNGTGYAAVTAFVVIFADHRGFGNVGLFYTFSAAGMFLTRMFSGRMADKFGVTKVAAPAIILQMASFVVLILTTSNVLFVALGFFFGLASGTVMPTLQAISIKNSPANRRGAASGTYQIANDIANGVGALLWGVIIDVLGYTSTFIGAILFGAAALVALVYFFGLDGLKNSKPVLAE